METENITAKILDDARKKAEEMISEAEVKVRTVLENACEETKEMDKKMEEDGEKLDRKETARILSLAEMEEKKRVLQEKISILEKIFNQALEHFRTTPEKEYREMMKGLLVKSVDHGDEEVVVAKNDKDKLGNEFLDSVNEELRKVGKKGNLKPSEEPGDFEGGVLLRKDRVETWCNFQVLLGSLKDNLEIEIAKFLFQSCD